MTQKHKTIRLVKTYIILFIGSILAAFGLEEFIIPNHFIDGGVVTEEGPARQVLTNPSHPRTREFLQRVLNPISEE